jgi:hypothetical protein
MAPGRPSRLRTGLTVAWLKLGSCTDQLASAAPSSIALTSKATPAISRRRRRTMSRSPSDRKLRLSKL